MAYDSSDADCVWFRISASDSYELYSGLAGDGMGGAGLCQPTRARPETHSDSAMALHCDAYQACTAIRSQTARPPGHARAREGGNYKLISLCERCLDTHLARRATPRQAARQRGQTSATPGG